MDQEVILVRKLELLQHIERIYNIEIGDDEIELIITFEDLINLLIKKSLAI